MSKETISLSFSSKKQIVIGIFSILLIIFYIYLLFDQFGGKTEKEEQKVEVLQDTTHLTTEIDSLSLKKKELEEKIEILNRYLVSKNLEVIDNNSKHYYKKN